MDDFMKIRFALDNVHPPSLGEGAHAAFDRVLNGVAMGDVESRDARTYARLLGGRMAGRSGVAAGARGASERPRLQVARVQTDESPGQVSLSVKQKEAATLI
jgi:hypothetical protein